MGRASIKQNKNIYQITREALGLTREKASEILEGLSADRIEKIENERSFPHPDEVMIMAKGYKKATLCNYYCSHECPIGERYVPEIEEKDLPHIVIEMEALINKVKEQQTELVYIAADGSIDKNELRGFAHIQKVLEKLSVSVKTLQLWVDQRIAEGDISEAEYQANMDNHE